MIVEQLMNKNVKTCSANDKVVGILSLNDLACHTGQRSTDVGAEEVVDTLSAICEHTHGGLSSPTTPA